jgi:hypothetical protein
MEAGAEAIEQARLLAAAVAAGARIATVIAAMEAGAEAIEQARLLAAAVAAGARIATVIAAMEAGAEAIEQARLLAAAVAASVAAVTGTRGWGGCGGLGRGRRRRGCVGPSDPSRRHKQKGSIHRITSQEIHIGSGSWSVRRGRRPTKPDGPGHLVCPWKSRLPGTGADPGGPLPRFPAT